MAEMEGLRLHCLTYVDYKRHLEEKQSTVSSLSREFSRPGLKGLLKHNDNHCAHDLITILTTWLAQIKESHFHG